MRKRNFFAVTLVTVFVFVLCMQPSWAASAKPAAEHMGKINARMDYASMSDMSDFDPGNPVIPKGDTIKIGVISTFSGPASMVGDISFFGAQWVAHDINKRGGILVDGKKKLIQVIKADNRGTPDGTRKAAERMAVVEKVNLFWGSTTSAMSKIMDLVANKYKIISVNMGYADDMHDAESFSRYSFMTDYSAEQIGRGFKQVQLFLQQESIGAQRDELLARNDAFDDLADVAMDERLAARDRHHRRTALIDGVKAFLHRQAPVQDRIRVVNLAATETGEIATEQGLQHQHQRISLAPAELLLEQICADAHFLQKRNPHVITFLFAG